jgi:hypothetical protein
MAEGIRHGVAAAVADSHARGLPVFVSEGPTVYAIFPDGRRVAVEHLPIARRRRSKALEPDHT